MNGFKKVFYSSELNIDKRKSVLSKFDVIAKRIEFNSLIIIKKIEVH